MNDSHVKTGKPSNHRSRILPLVTVVAGGLALGDADPAFGVGLLSDIDVVGFGSVATETDYIPNVVFFENGLGSFEALKAQAVAARSYAYYVMLTENRSLNNGTSDQVYMGSSGGGPSAIHFAAAEATAGEILTYQNQPIAGFYVAGRIPGSGDDLFTAAPTGGSDPTSTEQWVTYTELGGLIGGNNNGTPLGFPGATANRGAKSQNGADWLSDRSVNYVDILKYYYGADIQLETGIVSGSAERLPYKPLATFDDYGSGRVSDGIIDGHESIFAASPTFSGSNQNLVSVTADRSTAEAFTGTHSQEIVIDYDEASGSNFLLRHVSGSQGATNSRPSNLAAVVGNLEMQTHGTVGFWLKTTDPGVSVQIAIDNPVTADRGVARSIIADGMWHKYEWFLEDDSDWEAWVLGDGAITGSQFSLDSIQFFGATDATLFLDEVYWDPSGTPTLLAGDANGDGMVGLLDLDILGANWQATGATLAQGDFNGDGVVSLLDLDILGANWNASAAFSAALAASGIAVPEPTSLALIGGTLMMVLRRRRSVG